MTARFPTLERVLGGYFHRGWSHDDRTTGDVLAAILRDEPAERVRAVLRELDALLASGLCEPQLTDVVLYEIGCDIAPDAEGLDMSAWLRRVRETLARGAGAAQRARDRRRRG